MQQYILKIEMTNGEGALVRLLGLIQRRGYAVAGISMPSGGSPDKTVTLTVMPDHESRRIDVLQRQIERLYDVSRVTVASPARPKRILSFFTPAEPVMQEARA